MSRSNNFIKSIDLDTMDFDNSFSEEFAFEDDGVKVSLPIVDKLNSDEMLPTL